MKSSKILLFIILIIALLATCSFFFPKNGISIGPLQLSFPTIEETIIREKTALIQADSLWQMPDSLLTVTKDTLSYYRKTLKIIPSKFHFSNNNFAYFDSMFDKMKVAKQEGKTLRILHYGDSQIELDRLSSNIRTFFQEKFGGNGPGMLPLVQNIPSATVSQYFSGKVAGYAIYGETDRKKDGSYGVMGKSFTMTGDATFEVVAAKSAEVDSNAKRFSHVKLLLNVQSNSFTATLYNKNGNYEQTRSLTHTGLQMIEWQLPQPTTKLRISLHGNADIQGIMVDGEGGIAVDNIPMRGCSGTIFTKMNTTDFAKAYEMVDVALIILQFGGNSIPGINSQKAVDRYKEQITKQIQFFKQLCPQAKILFIGPSDMCTRYQGSFRTYSYLPATVQALKEAAIENNIAFWDLFSTMGGENSMISWVQNGWAGSDYIHFTNKGSKKAGMTLSNTFNAVYEFYMLRKNMPTNQFDKLWREIDI